MESKVIGWKHGVLVAVLAIMSLLIGTSTYAEDDQQAPPPQPQAEQITVGHGVLIGETVLPALTPSQIFEQRGGYNQTERVPNGMIYGSPEWVADNTRRESMEYADPNTGVIHSFGDGFGNQISREQYIQNVQSNQQMVEFGALRTKHEAAQYMKTASAGEDAEIAQSVIDSSDQAIKDVKEMSDNAIKQAQSLTPTQKYEKPKVLVSE